MLTENERPDIICDSSCSAAQQPFRLIWRQLIIAAIGCSRRGCCRYPFDAHAGTGSMNSPFHAGTFTGNGLIFPGHAGLLHMSLLSTLTAGSRPLHAADA